MTTSSANSAVVQPLISRVMPAMVTLWLAGYFFFPSNKLHYQFFILIFCLGGALLWAKHRFHIAWKPDSALVQVSGAFVVFYSLSLFWSVGTPFHERLGEIKSVLYLIIFTAVFTYCLRHSQNFLYRVLKVTLIAAVLALLFNFISFYFIDGQAVSARFHGFGRAWSPLWMAALYGALTVILVGVLTHAASQLSSRQYYLLIILATLFFLAVLATQSRMAIAATVVVSVIAVMTGNGSPRFKLLSALAIVLALLLTIWLSLTVFDRMVERGQSHRLNIWKGAMSLILEKPLLGYGAGSEIYIDTDDKKVDGWHYYHSSYVATLVDIGVTGFLLSLLMLAVAFQVAWRLREQFVVRMSAYVLLFCLLVSLTFGEGFISRMNAQWLLFWLPLIVIAHYEVLQKNQRSFSST
jgi:O-antigen ligase